MLIAVHVVMVVRARMEASLAGVGSIFVCLDYCTLDRERELGRERVV
jgi:hypothetical protein